MEGSDSAAVIQAFDVFSMNSELSPLLQPAWMLADCRQQSLGETKERLCMRESD